MSGLEAAGVALDVFKILYAAAKLVKTAAKDFKTATSQFATLLEDIEQCEQYATLVKKSLQKIPSTALTPREQISTKKHLDSILQRAKEFKKWTQENMIRPEDNNLKQLQKKFKVAFGKLRKIDSALRTQFEKLRKVAPEITMRLQSLVLDVVLENQGEIASLHQKMDCVIEKVSRLSDLIEQPLPAYSDIAFDSTDIDEIREEKAHSESLLDVEETFDYPRGTFDNRNNDSHSSLYDIPSDDNDLDFSDREGIYSPYKSQEFDYESGSRNRGRRPEAAPWTPTVVAVGAVATILWVGARILSRH